MELDTLMPFFRGFFGDQLFELICRLRGIESQMIVPHGVEVCQRVTPAGENIYFLINHHDSPKMVAIHWEAREHLSGFPGKGELTLSPYGIAILTKEV